MAPSQFPAFSSPVKAGLGFKPSHLQDILSDRQQGRFFEVHAENYMGAGGAPHGRLSALRELYPLSVHGVGLSIGGAGPLDARHLDRLNAVVKRYEPFVVSEHLAWSTHGTSFFNDLLPVPYTNEVLTRVCEHVETVQDVLGRHILLENPSTYVTFENSTLSETDFIRSIVHRTGCRLLLDLNNVFVSATNHGWSAEKYLEDFPLRYVDEIHLAGHATEAAPDGGKLLIDAHDRKVCEEVWALYAHVLEAIGYVPTLVEWDNDVPEWSILKSEAVAADAVAAKSQNGILRHAG